MGEWTDAVDKLCKSLELTSFMGLEYTFNSTGAGAHAKFLREMASKLDVARELETAAPPNLDDHCLRQGGTHTKEQV